MVQITWVRAAKIDLKEIYNYISKDSRKYAKFQVLKIEETIKSLETNPELGKHIRNAENLTIREIVEGHYRIIYKIISKDKIDILMIHHGARDLSRRL